MKRKKPILSEMLAVAALKAQDSDALAAKAALEILKKSPTAVKLLRFAANYGYRFYFVDLKAFNRHRHAKGLPRGKALHFSNKEIFSDIGSGKSAIFRAVKLAHELAHALQYYHHFKIEKFKTVKALRGALNYYGRISSTMEAQCIAMEYIVAAELIANGVNEKEVHKAPYGRLPASLVNLLLYTPDLFIENIAASKLVRKEWKLKEHQAKILPKIVQDFAAALPPLCRPWVDMPQIPSAKINPGPPRLQMHGRPS